MLHHLIIRYELQRPELPPPAQELGNGREQIAVDRPPANRVHGEREVPQEWQRIRALDAAELRRGVVALERAAGDVERLELAAVREDLRERVADGGEVAREVDAGEVADG